MLASWRPDLQGRERQESKNLEKDVIVTTSYGQVQGFYVYLYDNPLPESGFRPDQIRVERIQGTVSAFLGIPYALPPINEGRFRVSSDDLSCYFFCRKCTTLVSCFSHLAPIQAGKVYTR